MTDITNLIGGRWTGARNGRVTERRNPANVDQVVVSYPWMDEADADAALGHAHAAARGWRNAGPIARGTILLAAATQLRANADTIARDVTSENGKTLREAKAEVGAAAAFFEYFGGWGRGHVGSRLPDRRPKVESWSVREPLGVVVLITPWNDPLATPARKMAPALLCGNAVVLKPSSETPLSAYHLARALAEAGLPDGVLNVVTGPSSEVGTGLVTDERVAAVSFTGSTQVGLGLHRQLAGSVTRLQTEMGGKNAALLLADADLDLAVDTITGAACGQGGQRCTATSRVVVQRDVATEVVERLTERFAGLTIGPGDSDDAEMGPLVTEQHLEGVLTAVEQLRAEGKATVTGGERVTGEFSRGHFMSPALVTDVESSDSIWHTELFGPVVAVRIVDTFEEGIEAVNDSSYGLSASIFTRDLAAAHVFIDAVETGQVGVNLPTIGWDVHVPFGGFRESGSPFKEHGEEGLRFYSRVKSVALQYA